MFFPIKLGAILSSTVTIASLELELPLTSVTVKETILAPISAQVKSDLSKTKLAILQLSEDPVSISEVVIETIQLEAN
jgi:hypothetical protein